MAELPSVEINRTCLSLLFRDNAASLGDQEGFLIGEIVERVKKISDAEENAGKTTVIRITSTFSLPKHCKFYNGIGKIDVDALQGLLGPYNNKIVGYFDFKRNMPPEVEDEVTFIQMNVLKQLTLLADHTPFIFMRLRHRHESNGTILNAYTYYTMDQQGSFMLLSSSIPNLGDTSHDRYVQNTAVPLVDKWISKMGRPKTDPESLPVVKAHNALMEQLKLAAEEAFTLEMDYQEVAKLLSIKEENLREIKMTPIAKNNAANEAVPSTSKTSTARSSSQPHHSESPMTGASRRRSVIVRKR
ncbi:BRISC complex subunit FAM175B-like [Cloeon dipterum]|uniref:BRISC complex subunit FAM175B-like n=1 Tax=Cloeon dipterum TaxID=197152 RepID=UPI00321F66D5